MSSASSALARKIFALYAGILALSPAQRPSSFVGSQIVIRFKLGGIHMFDVDLYTRISGQKQADYLLRFECHTVGVTISTVLLKSLWKTSEGRGVTSVAERASHSLHQS